MNPTVTTTVVASIKSATSYCIAVKPKEYVIDCLAERLENVNRQIAGQPGYEDVSQVLSIAANDLTQIARQNRSATLPPAWYATKGATPVATERALIPVDQGKLAAATTQALAVIEEAQTTLLRSAEGSTQRALQFQQIAAAIGSNKVLLRSTG